MPMSMLFLPDIYDSDFDCGFVNPACMFCVLCQSCCIVTCVAIGHMGLEPELFNSSSCGQFLSVQQKT